MTLERDLEEVMWPLRVQRLQGKSLLSPRGITEADEESVGDKQGGGRSHGVLQVKHHPLPLRQETSGAGGKVYREGMRSVSSLKTIPQDDVLNID